MKVMTGASIILTEACNLECSYCYEKRKTPEVMDVDTVKKAVKFIFDNSPAEASNNLIWFGGEPLLNFNVMKEGFAYAKELGQGRTVDHLIVTNGTILTDEIFEFFKANPDLRIQLSWDGMPEFQEVERGQSALFEKNLERYITLDNHLTAHVQVTPTMAVKLLENVDYIASKMKTKMRVVLRPIPEVDGWTEEVVQEFGQQLYKVYEKYGEKIDKIANCEHALTSNGLCGAGKNFGSITPAGDIYACHRFYFNKNRDFKVGTLDGGFVESAKTDLLEEYTRENIIGCEDCDACELCDRCIASNFGENFDVLLPSDNHCAIGRTAFFSLYNYIKAAKPWMTNYEPKEIMRIAAPPAGVSSMEFVMNYVLPMIYDLQGRNDFLEDQLVKLSAKVEYYENTRRTAKHTAVYNK